MNVFMLRSFLCYNSVMMELYGTLGPSCADIDILRKMLRSGITGMRLNLSHTTLRAGSPLCDLLRQACEAEGKSCSLMIDMQGPELRIGDLPAPLTIREGSVIAISEAPAAEGEGIPVPETVMEYAVSGDILMMNDGRIKLELLEDPALRGRYRAARGKVLAGGTLSARKSIAIEGKDLSGSLLTEEDLQNLSDAARMGVDCVMQPFVHSGADLVKLREIMDSAGLEHCRIFAKIEDRIGLRHVRDIMSRADCVVIARGDLGNAMPLWELPAAQKRIAKTCSDAGKPFLVVTQLLASMEENPVPTRAEVSDIFNAVADGAGALMLTGETAAGRYPDRAAYYLVKTVREALSFYGRQV